MSKTETLRRLLISSGPKLDSLFENACHQAAEAAGYEFLLCETETELEELLAAAGWAYVLRQQHSIEDLKAEILFVRKFLSQIREGRLVPISLNWLAHGRTQAILKRLGFAQVITAISLRPQALKVRLETLLRTENIADAQHLPAGLENLSHGFNYFVRQSSFEMIEPLQLPENCWLLRRPEDVRIVQDQWIIDLVGPGPSAGVWTRREDAELNYEDGHSVWEWKAKKPDKLFFGENGSWVFWGKRPRFQDFHWIFISKNPQLSFLEESETKAHILAVNQSRKLQIPANSEIALKKWPAIHASVLNDYKLRVPAAVINNPNIRFEKAQENEIPWRDLMGVAEPEGSSPISKTTALYQIQRELAPKEPLFTRIAGKMQRESYLRELMKTDANAQIWTPGQQVRFNARIINVLMDIPALSVKIPSDIDAESLFGRLYVNLSYRRGSLFFTIDEKSIGFDGNHLIIKVPADVYEVQRRNYFRLAIPEDSDCFVRIADRFFKVLNISAGGLAFFADQNDEEIFKKGVELEQISFEISTIRIRCHAEICWSKVSKEASEGANLKVGLRFRSLHPSSQQALNLFVLEEGYEYLKEHLVDAPRGKH
ncbi:MAG TPA: hypothetical protein DCS07_17210 [Bdellovibrionales bacterium]|nr:MAG: hypothetical protein A2Z97_12005 [Bdellovibrionales bacterium GWB1_52_6]OFZ06044.1 MAG: hypothetical protein A2X97_01770 [Bdellovibrionales bacterium GWA1_52_35]OFZ37074.1 MAG: hypothetical protein A2070_11110 [Bdellovibrionales bacterium GWC1_52_8]HAR44341.1 hypothetical protein [Bdellovibrionales bacterium]HCM39331.1 hypothetical protein [Bdellovibrionales bacterium]